MACRRLSRTPHALHSVLGPSGPLRHSGVVCVLQCAQRLPGMPGRRPELPTSSSICIKAGIGFLTAGRMLGTPSCESHKGPGRGVRPTEQHKAAGQGAEGGRRDAVAGRSAASDPRRRRRYCFPLIEQVAWHTTPVVTSPTAAVTERLGVSLSLPPPRRRPAQRTPKDTSIRALDVTTRRATHITAPRLHVVCHD